MKKRLSSLLSILGMILGMVVVVPILSATQASAGPLPAEGTHTARFSCNDGIYHSTFSATYNLQYYRTELSSSGGVQWIDYTFQLLTATYTGPTGMNPARGPQMTVESGWGSSAHSVLNSTVGGSNNTGKYVFGAGDAHAPVTVLNSSTGSTGSGPWLPISLKTNPAESSNLMGRVFWYSRPACAGANFGKFDLHDPDGIKDGLMNTESKQCVDDTGTDLVIDTVDSTYDVFHLSGDTYGFQLTSVYADISLETDSIGLKLVDTTGASIDIEPHNPGGNPPLQFSGPLFQYPQYTNPDGTKLDDPYTFIDGQGGINFPQISFKREFGDQVPYIQFTFNRIFGSEVQPCVLRYDLVDNWIPEDVYSNSEQINFNDCSANPQPAGTLTVTGYWKINSNGTKTKLDRVSIQNNSAAKLVMPVAGRNDSPNNPIYQTGYSGDLEIAYLHYPQTTANRRYWNAGETRDLNIKDPIYWTILPGNEPATAPNQIKLIQPPNIGAMSIDFDAVSSLGAACSNGYTLDEVTVASYL